MTLQTFFGRMNPSSPLYQGEVESSWRQLPRDYEQDLFDTKKPIASFKIEEKITVTIHNFPLTSLEDSVSLEAQVARWQRQLGHDRFFLTPTSHSGFIGIILESEEVITAAFQLAPYYKRLWKQGALTLHTYNSTIQENNLDEKEDPPMGEEMGRIPEYFGDWTIKAVGPKDLLRSHRPSLLKLIHSFEPVHEILSVRLS